MLGPEELLDLVLVVVVGDGGVGHYLAPEQACLFAVVFLRHGCWRVTVHRLLVFKFNRL